MKLSFKFFPAWFYDAIFLSVLFFISLRRLLVCWYVVSLDYYCEYGDSLTDYILWGLLFLSAVLLLFQRGKFLQYCLAWKSNWALALFVLYSVASVTWSVSPENSVHMIYIVVFASLTAATLAFNFTLRQLLKIFFSFALVCGILSLLLIVLDPNAGVHQDRVWLGAWHGIFIHKNDFGAFMALGGGLSLLSFFNSTRTWSRLVYGCFCLLVLFFVVMSLSATGLVLWLILNGLLVIFFIWKRMGSSIQGKNMVYVARLSVVTVLLGAFSLVLASSLLGKNMTLSGRIPMWGNLLKYVISQKPWFGYGLETLWLASDFQRWMGEISEWGIAIVLHAHNGYMDILLHLGLVGLVLFLIILVQTGRRTVQRMLSSLSWLDFFPFLVLIYFLVSNVTSSYVLNYESFHWILLVTLLFLPQQNEDKVR